MKKGLLVVLGLVLLAGLLLVGCDEEEDASPGVGEGLISSQDLRALLASDNSQQTGVWVSGTGKVSVVPDVAVLRLGVEAMAATVAEAQSDTAVAMTGVMAVLDANGVAEKDIQTQRFSISQVTEWDEDSRKQIVIGYEVTNIVTAKIRDIDKTGTIIDAAAEAGGDLIRIESIWFTVDEPEAYYDEAREEAILDAMAKAEQMASTADVTLGKLIYMTESGGPVPPPYPQRDYAYAEGFSATTPISTGEMDISVTVQMVYALQ